MPRGALRSAAPLVSVVIPARNADATLSATLESVARQSYRPLEVLICDDGSTDRSLEIAEAFLAGQPDLTGRLLHGEGRGASHARNLGIQAAEGELVAFLDSDDLWAPDKLTRSILALQQSGADLLCHSERWRDERGTERIVHYSGLFDARLPPGIALLRHNPFSTSAVTVRRARLRELGDRPFDEAIPSSEDYDLWIRLVSLPGFRVSFLDEPLGVYLVRSGGNESSRLQRRHAAMLEIGRRARTGFAGYPRTPALESLRYRAKVYVSSGRRYLSAGRPLRGTGMLVLGLVMWPFRLDWIVTWLKRRRA